MSYRPKLDRCLTGGRHTPGSDWEAECPLRKAEARSERSRIAAQTRRARALEARSRSGKAPVAGRLANGIPEATSSPPSPSRTS
jgi:hypothetical protein